MPIQMVHILVLILCANAIPVLLRKIFIRSWLAHPIDNGFCLNDGHPLLGNSKTWRGLLGSLFFTPLVGMILGFSYFDSLLIAILAMFGDLLSSFIKRRMGLASSRMALFLDQFPESGFPLLYASQVMMLISLKEVLVGMILFLLLELVLSRIFFYMGIRKRPY